MDGAVHVRSTKAEPAGPPIWLRDEEAGQTGRCQTALRATRSARRHGRPAAPGVRSVPAGPGAAGRPHNTRAASKRIQGSDLHRPPEASAALVRSSLADARCGPNQLAIEPARQSVMVTTKSDHNSNGQMPSWVDRPPDALPGRRPPAAPALDGRRPSVAAPFGTKMLSASSQIAELDRRLVSRRRRSASQRPPHTHQACGPCGPIRRGAWAGWANAWPYQPGRACDHVPHQRVSR
jgi:hypothetical protein